MINQKLQDFEEEVKPLGDLMTQVNKNMRNYLVMKHFHNFIFYFKATVDLYNAIVARMLPTPTKIHYLFNLRDISKV